MKRVNFLDPSAPHTLSEQECELITFFRSFSKSKRELIFQMLFAMAMEDIKPKEKEAL